MIKNKYYFELTDTFCGELNYSWLHRFEVTAKSMRGALQKLSRETGFNFRFNGSYWKAERACIGLYELDPYGEGPDQDWIDKAKSI